LLPQGSNSQFDAFAVTAVVLLALGLIVIAYLAGRRSAARKKP
jgi:predicted dienelactone hydrolase